MIIDLKTEQAKPKKQNWQQAQLTLNSSMELDNDKDYLHQI